MSNRVRIGLIFALYVTSISSHAIFGYLSRAHGQMPFDPRLAVFCSEIIKLVFSSLFFMMEKDDIIPLKSLFSTSLVMFVPAFLYFMTNSIYYFVIENVSPAVYTIIGQLRHPITAVLAFFFLQKKFSSVQWKALLLLSIGAALVQLRPVHSHQEYNFFGTALLVFQCFLSGIAGIYFEKVLKHRKPEISIWARNIQLSCATILIGTFYFTLAPSDIPIRNYLNPMIILVILNGALNGILTALVVLHADTIVKNFGTSLSVIFTSVVEFVIFKVEPHVNFFFGGLIVLISLWIYMDPIVKPSECKEILEKNDTFVQTIDVESNDNLLGKDISAQDVDSVELIETELYLNEEESCNLLQTKALSHDLESPGKS
jgi:UDP-sugar transporter A1/2/3